MKRGVSRGGGGPDAQAKGKGEEAFCEAEAERARRLRASAALIGGLGQSAESEKQSDHRETVEGF